MIADRFYDFLTRCATTKRVYAVLAVAAALTAVSAILLPRLPIQTSREGMVDKNLPVQKRYLEFTGEFGTQNQLVLLLEGDPETTRAAADEAAAALTRDPAWVRNVFHRIDLAPFRKAGLYYLPEETLTKIAAGLGDYVPLLSGPLAKASLAETLGALESQAKKITPDALNDATKVAEAVRVVDGVLAQWQGYLDSDAPARLDLEKTLLALAAGEGGLGTDADGYLVGDGGRIHILFVQQSKSIDDTEFTIPFMGYCRRTVADVLKDHPGVTAGFTGWPVSIEEEIALIESDLGRITVFTVVVVLALFLVSFRSLKRTILVFIPLVFGLLWNFGLTVFTVGRLNYLTSAFVGILFGMGIDYGVLILRRFDEERASGHEVPEALAHTMRAVGPSVVAGGGTVVVSFLAIGATKQPAFSDLGIIAGTGIFCVVLSTLFVLPGLVALFPPKARHYGTRHTVESPWLHWIATRVLAFPRTIAITALAAALLLFAAVPRVGFDYDLNSLLPKDSETVRVGTKLEESTPFKTQYITLIADTLDQERRLLPLLKAKETVQHVESISSLLPDRQEEKRPLLKPIGDAVGALRVGTPGTAPDVAALRARVAALVERLENAQADLFETGKGEVVKQFDVLLKRLRAIETALDGANAAAREAAFEKDLFALVATTRESAIAMTTAEPVTMDSLDPVLRERFVGTKGRLAIFIFPKDVIWNMPFLDRFLRDAADAARAVYGTTDGDPAERITGFGAVYQTTARLIRRGFSQASWTAGIVVLLVLFLALRKPRAVALATLPLVVAVAGTLGGLGLLGKDLNLASQISLPIMLGAAVDFGIFMTRRWLEPDGANLPRVVGTMGSSVLLAATCAMTGFGSLLLARHRGMNSFGGLLLLAVFLAMVTSQFLIPVVIKALHLDKRVPEPHTAANR
jgi:predicted RND superfamily exporter protein